MVDMLSIIIRKERTADLESIQLQVLFTLVLIDKIFVHKVEIIFLRLRLNISFCCSKELSCRDGSFEYPQHMFWSRNKKVIF